MLYYWYGTLCLDLQLWYYTSKVEHKKDWIYFFLSIDFLPKCILFHNVGRLLIHQATCVYINLGHNKKIVEFHPVLFKFWGGCTNIVFYQFSEKWNLERNWPKLGKKSKWNTLGMVKNQVWWGWEARIFLFCPMVKFVNSCLMVLYQQYLLKVMLGISSESCILYSL